MSSCDTGHCGTGGWAGPLPGDPDNNAILAAESVFGGILVSWTLPGLNPHAVAYVELYVNTTPFFASASLLKTVADTEYYDRRDTGATYYYWIRIVSINGTRGEPIGYVSAVAKPLIEDMIELLTEQIDAGLLAQSLKTDLAQISILNANLANEITARENGEITLAEAIAAAEAGVAEALTFINTEITSRTAADAAIAESLTLVAATLGDDIAAVQTTLTASVDALTGDVYSMYTAKLTVNGLVGGFGIVNDGDEVEAGFDVDTFWIGRTSADKRKPFIVDDGVVYIDEGAINKLTFSKLRDESGLFLVEDGRIKAQYIKANSASIEDLSVTTAKLANAAITEAKIGTAAITEAKIGTAAITNAKLGTASVDTLQIAGNAVTIPSSVYSAGGLLITEPGGHTGGVWTVQTLSYTSTGAPVAIWTSCRVGGDIESTDELRIYRNGTLIRQGAIFGTGNPATLLISDTPPAGAVTYTLSLYKVGGPPFATAFMERAIVTLETKR